MPQMTFPATLDNIERATDFMNGILESAECPIRAQTKLDIALDELMSNVARYAYAPDTGDVTISVEDPAVTLSAEERRIGGLGIFIVKQSMDDMSYAYRDNRNVVTIVKNL